MVTPGVKNTNNPKAEFLYCFSMAVIYIFVTGLFPANAQNLLGNNGFETNISLPNGFGQWNKCSGWNNVNMYPGFAWPYASPDYLTIGGSGGAGLPNSTFATVNPYSGNAVMGLVAYYQPSADFREYLARPLSTPLITGNTYTISFYITNGSSAWYTGGGCNHFGIKFSMGPLTQINHEPLNIIPDCEISTVLWSTTWKLVTFTYTATAPFNNITIGNFYNDLNTTCTMFGTGTTGAYYFIDEAVVSPAATLPVEWTSFTGNRQGNVNLLKWRTATEFNNDYFAVERSMDGIKFTCIGKVDGSGNSNTCIDYFFNDNNPLSAITYYRLNQFDFNGVSRLSEIIKIDDRLLSSIFNITACSGNGQFQISIFAPPEGHLQYAVYNSSGKLVAPLISKHVSGFVTGQIDLSGNASGVYFVDVLLNGQSFRRKILKC